MKKIILTLFTLFVAFAILGQSTETDLDSSNELKLSSLEKVDPSPQFVIVVDSINIKVDKFKDYNFEPKWIETITVLTDDISKKVYGNKNGAIIIYTKKEYRNEILKELDKNGT